ncbi:type VII secretion integral membrane protein EccD [Mycolicibacterium sp. XJ870]
MPDTLRHVSIHCEAVIAGQDCPAPVDLTLPAWMPVGRLIPPILDAVGANGDTVRHWRLGKLGGVLLNEAMTLVQNDIHDGDLLLLSEAVVQPPRSHGITVALTTEAPVEPHPALRSAGFLWASLLGTSAVVCAGLGTEGPGRIVAVVVLTAVLIAAALAAQRIGLGRPGATSLNVTAVAHAAVLGLLVVPAGPGPANFFLAAVAAASLGVVLIRLSSCGTEVLLAIVTLAAAAAVVTACAVLWPMGVPQVGAVLSALAMGGLSLTPRLSIALAGLTPRMPDVDDPGEPLGDTTIHVDFVADRGHRILIGLVAGCAGAAALGTLLVATGGRDPVTGAAMAFTAAVGVALLLRSRSYASGQCRTALNVAGFCSLSSMFVLVAAWAPAYGGWTGVAAVSVGLATLMPAAITSPLAVRIVHALEYGALAAIAPLACWLAGIFDLVGGLGPL